MMNDSITSEYNPAMWVWVKAYHCHIFENNHPLTSYDLGQLGTPGF